MPSRKYFTERVIPDLFENVSSALMEKVAGAISISLSTDTWTTDVTTESYFGLTAHTFEHQSYVLHWVKFSFQHTATNLLSAFD